MLPIMRRSICCLLPIESRAAPKETPMLVLARKVNESIVIDGRIVVKIIRLDGDVVKLGISAPADVPVHRQEVYEEIQKSNQQALINPHVALPKLSRDHAMPFAVTAFTSTQTALMPRKATTTPIQTEQKTPRNNQ